MMTSNVGGECLKYQRKLLRLAGISFAENDTVWYNVYSILMIIIIWSFPATVFYALLTNHYTLYVILDNISYSVACVNSCLKIAVAFYLRKKIAYALTLLQSDIFTPNINRGGEKEQELLNECEFYNRFQATFFGIMTVINMGCVILESLIPRFLSNSDLQHWELPYGVFTVFDATYSPYFELAFLYQLIAVAIICAGMTAVTTFTAGVMAYISYQCKMLQNFISISVRNSKAETEELDSENQDINKIENRRKRLQKIVKEIVEYHTAILDLAAKFEELLNVLALLDFLGLSFVICIALFTASVYRSINLHFLDLLLLACGNLVLQFVTSYWGNQVIIESEAVARACYDAEFIGKDIRFQKSWLVIMKRSQIAIQFTVGKFAPLSLNTFQKVIQSSYSYFMLLNHFNEERVLED